MIVTTSWDEGSSWVVMDIRPDAPGKAGGRTGADESPFDKSFCLAAVLALGGKLSRPYDDGVFRLALRADGTQSELVRTR